MGTLMEVAQAAHERASRASVAEMAGLCQRLLGQRVVAYVTGHKTPKIVGQWALGNNTPHDEAKERLRALYRTIQILEPYEASDTIQAWMVGANPRLDDRAPVELLRDGELVPVYKAAENFVDA